MIAMNPKLKAFLQMFGKENILTPPPPATSNHIPVHKSVHNPVPLTIGSGIDLGKIHREKEPIQIRADERIGHFWGFGSQGQGKTRLFEEMICQDIANGRSVVVIDPKGDIELFSMIVQKALAAKRIGDLTLVTPIYPQFSAQIDPLKYYITPEEIAQHIVAGVSVGKEPFFANVAYDLALTVSEGLDILKRHISNKKTFNLDEVYNYISQTGLENLKQQLMNVHDEQYANSIRSIIRKIDGLIEGPEGKNNREYFNKISGSLRVAIGELTSGNIGKIIGLANTNEFINRLEQDKPVIMVVQTGSMMMRRASHTAGKIILSMIHSAIGRKLSSGGFISPALSIFADEAHNTIYPGFEDLLAKGRAAHVSVHGMVQGVSQMIAEVGQERTDVILDTTATKVFFQCPNPKEAKWIADHFGEAVYFQTMFNAGKAGAGISGREDSRTIVRPEDVMNLPKRHFLCRTYNRVYKGKTLQERKRILKVKFPKLSVLD